ncbi:MAG: hypothetical protein QOD53_759 [Thermoleophilaceae bacterium]|nr:hypothetical protein [Thermoleophilaceae bacterium]
MAAPGPAQSSALEAHCPHCMLVVAEGVEGEWPPAPTRCPHCKLMIGTGRARDAGDGAPGARGAAAGVLARDAQRNTDPDDHASADEVRQGIRTVARELGSSPERLLMVDYQQRAADDEELPDLTDIFATFGSWKAARREAAAA